MKRGKVLMAVLVVMAVLFASCSNGLSEGDAAVAKLAPVNLTVNMEGQDAGQKAMALVKPEDGYTYWVKAKAEWTGSNTHNDFVEWTRIAYSGAQSDVGYFTPGTWTFTVHIMAGNADATTYDVTKVVYAGSTSAVIAIGKSTTEVPITVSKYNDSSSAGTGSVIIKVAVPVAARETSGIVAPDVTLTISGNDGTSAYSYAETSIASPTQNKKVDTSGEELYVGDTHGTVAKDVANWYYFTKTFSDTDNTALNAGTYTFILKYYDKTGTGKQQIGGATFAVTVRSGEQYGIYGTIENGEYQIAQMTVTMPEEIKVMITTDSPAEVNPGATVTFETVPEDPTTHAILTTVGATLDWYVNGVHKAGPVTTTDTATSYTLDTSKPGIYDVKCTVTKGDATTASHCQTIKVVPPVIIISRIGDAGANTDTITTAQTLVCRPSVYIPGATYEWYLGTATSAAATGNSYSFTNSSAGSYTITCKALVGTEVKRVGSKTITVSASTNP